MARKLFRIFLIILFIPIAASAQELSSVTGRVTMEGEPLPGANVVLTNVETGVFSGTIANNQGFYSLSDLYPGKYTIKFSFVGCVDNVYDLELFMGDNSRIDVEMNQSSNTLQQIDIVAESTAFNQLRTGLSTVINHNLIETLPSIERTLPDYVRISPFVGLDNSLSGRDGRLTGLTLDGVSINNAFGSTAQLPGAGSPISIEAVKEVQVAIAPFDVSQSNFIGGSVNAITKAGSNSLQGSVYGFYSNQNFSGSNIAGTKVAKDNWSKIVGGITLGGPIVKDRLFFFINYEYDNRPQPVSRWKLSQDGIANSSTLTSRVTQADMDAFSAALSQYGYNPGSTDLTDGGSVSHRGMVRLDWNISKKHNLMARFNLSQNTQAYTPSARTTFGPKTPSDRVGADAYVFSNNCYRIHDGVWSGEIDLKSNVTPMFSNRFTLSVSDVYNERSSNSSQFPHIDILDGNGNAFMSAGYELFSYNTGNNVRTYNLREQAKITLTNNIVTLGFTAERQETRTNYMQAGLGYYKYASLQDFQNQAAPVAFAMTYGYGQDLPMAKTNTSAAGLYFQDQLTLDRFVLTAGLRADAFCFTNKLIENTAVSEISWRNGLKINTGQWPAFQVAVSPRVGFNYDVNGDNHFLVRGGAGIFSGRVPTIIYANVPLYSGLIQNTAIAYTGTNDELLSGLQGKFYTTRQELQTYLADKGYPQQPTTTVLPSTVCGVYSKFKLPQTIKTSIGTDYKFYTKMPMSIQAEVIYSKDLNAFYINNYNLNSEYNFSRYLGEDNRINYYSTFVSETPYINNNVNGGACVLDNTGMGWGLQGYFTFNMEPVKNLQLSATYAYQHIMSLQTNDGSQMYSIWSSTPSVDSPNERLLKRSAFAIPHKVSAYLSYKLNYCNDRLSTSFGLFYTAHTSGLYSYMYTNDMNGDGNVNDLIYVPSTKEGIKFVDTPAYTAQEQRDAFWAFVESDPYLSTRKGKYAEANAATLKWTHRLDFRFTQDFIVYSGKKEHTLQLTFDIVNLPNLLNSNWGVQYGAGACNYGRILKYEGQTGNVPQFSLWSNRDGLVSKSNEVIKSSEYCWQIQFGLSYKF